ncbi:hypothetical protein ACLD5N_03560 [Gardnerella leopoldii]|uniref:hypothetical protein n=1 Tax=Gardnerella leopoldii TaxID=2792978 RepID=UPI003971095E
MLNKKAIAAFAAGATLVSGLVFAAPAMAESPVNGGSNPSAVQGDQVTTLDNVVFSFKVDNKDHKTTAITLYKKGDKYGATKDDITHTVAQIGAGLLAQVQNNLTPAQGDSVVDTGTVGTITYPTEIKAGENTVPVTLTYKSDVTDDVVKTMAGLGDFKAFEAQLKKNHKKISPAQKALFDAQRAKVEEAISKDKAKKDALIAEAERFGLPKSVIDALKDYAKSKESAAVAKLLAQGKKNAIEELAKKADAEGLTFVAKLIRNSKKSTLTALKNLLKEAEIAKRHTNNAVAPAVNNVPEYNGADLFKGLTYDQAKALYEEMNANAEAAKKAAKDGKLDADTVKLLAQAKAAFQKIVKAEIEKIAQQAEKEGFTFTAKLIRKAKTVEGARALLAEAEKSKKLTPKPINPLTPVPSQPSGNGAGTGNGAGNVAGNTNDNKTTKNATKNAANVAAPLAKTGAAVALVAVVASVLAGVGAALRKIRH